MLRKIRLYGKLAKFIGHRVLKADVASTAEAIRFLLANWPELEQHMADQFYRVSLNDRDIDLDELHDPIGQQTIKIIPVVSGAGAVGRILAGIALVVGSIFIGPSALLFGIALKSVVFGIGASLVLGGVAQLLSPVPKLPTGPDTDNDPRKNYSFSSIQNTSRQGVPVPIVYGEVLVGSVVISAGIDVAQVAS